MYLYKDFFSQNFWQVITKLLIFSYIFFLITQVPSTHIHTDEMTAKNKYDIVSFQFSRSLLCFCEKHFQDGNKYFCLQHQKVIAVLVFFFLIIFLIKNVLILYNFLFFSFIIFTFSLSSTFFWVPLNDKFPSFLNGIRLMF